MWQFAIYVWILIIFLGLICYFLKTNKKEKFPYKKRISVMTDAEQKMFRQLEQEYGDQYYIFPQINLDKLVEITDQTNYYYYFNKINRKSVDFVLADKISFETVRVIELDDYTHEFKGRRKRDMFVDKVLHIVNIETVHQKF